MFPKLAVTALSFAASAQAAISILYPNSETIWYKNNTVHMNWTLTMPETDTYLFRTYLSNSDQSVLAGNHSIADSTSATAQDVRILLPQIPSAKGYIVNLVNTTNEAQVFATSNPFEVADGIVTTSSTTGSSTSSSSATAGNNNNDIPNAKTTSYVHLPSPPFPRFPFLCLKGDQICFSDSWDSDELLLILLPHSQNAFPSASASASASSSSNASSSANVVKDITLNTLLVQGMTVLLVAVGAIVAI
uniref:Ser-Thr-rich glycosyl-phosphatidyl-inositol-anchored membrane family-domain-containing protein n=1 Tax=Kwoniella dejecticola CBS 10117 TaxID=1296121 RepID=A0A1A5ZZN2_9TREE|nr:uncharacterized protein I303_06821 [Kwoniella dejecticola CBS 10117]OBR83258.1 hypothetical protein I303_06821 [Kwoniella dejecticola CBS 10117]